MTLLCDRGDVVRLTAMFSDMDDVPTDPSTVVLRVRDPANVVTEHTAPAVTNPAVGTHQCEIPASLAGTYYYRWEATGAVTAAEEGEFKVRESKVIA